MKLYRTSAFSLVELSIVLVILGLLVGGVLTGQSLIRAAELRSVTTEFRQYQTAVQTFRDRFFALPGDMRNAEDFWGTMSSGTCPNATGGTGTQTCNGDGNGFIEGGTGAASQTSEHFTFWQHLTNAGLIEGSFTGLAGSGGNTNAVFAENSPPSRFSNGGWFVSTYGTSVSGVSGLFDGAYMNAFLIGAATGAIEPTGNILLPEEAWNIDTKVDDGLPATGIVVPRTRAICTDATAAVGDSDNFDAEYNLTQNSTACALIFRNTL